MALWFLVNPFHYYYEELFMNNLYKDILTGLVFITGLFGFVSGEFIISSTLFAAATIASNININSKKEQSWKNSMKLKSVFARINQPPKTSLVIWPWKSFSF